MIDYIEQGIDNLHYCLAQDIKKDHLTILLSEEKKIGEWTVEANIIGESHYIKILRNNKQLVEVVACIKIEDEWVENGYANGVLISEHKTQSDIYNYDFVSQILDLDKNIKEISLLEEKAMLDNGNISLRYVFPGNDFKYCAQTIVLVDSKSYEQLEITTVHTYPNINKVLFTKSLINS